METMEIFSQTICPQIPVKAFSDPPPSSSIVLWVSSPLTITIGDQTSDEV